MNRVDPVAVRTGALTDLVMLTILVVVSLLARAVHAGGFGTAVIVLASVVPPVAGGFTAGRRDRRSPLTSGAAAAGVATTAYVVFRLVDATVRANRVHPVSVVIFVMLGLTLGVLGGFAGFRTGRP